MYLPLLFLSFWCQRYQIVATHSHKFLHSFNLGNGPRKQCYNSCREEERGNTERNNEVNPGLQFSQIVFKCKGGHPYVLGPTQYFCLVFLKMRRHSCFTIGLLKWQYKTVYRPLISYQDRKEEKAARTNFYLYAVKPLLWHCLWQQFVIKLLTPSHVVATWNAPQKMSQA